MTDVTTDTTSDAAAGDGASSSDEKSQIDARTRKMHAWREDLGGYPNDFRRSQLVTELQEKSTELDREALTTEQIDACIAGRLMSRRIMGKASFAHIQDVSGQLQLYVSRDVLGAEAYEKVFLELDIGDIVGVSGKLMRTKKGELSIQVQELRLLTKALRPLPEKFHGLTDPETRYRRRYVDLVMNEQVRNTFRQRSRIIQLIRQFMLDHEYMEVETPMMHPIPGGAVARPFETHHNALDMAMYMRIAPELYLKKLVVGGFEKVFEINRNFRNEGVSTKHNPEFTMMEFYSAYEDYQDLMNLTEQMFRDLAAETSGNTSVEYQGMTLDFGKDFNRLTMHEAVLAENPALSVSDLQDNDAMRNALKVAGGHAPADAGLGKILFELFEATVEDKLLDPTFIISHPTEVSPLSRRNDHQPELTDRFELFIGGREIANGFSELNDPEDQAQRFRDQVVAKDAGDDEAMHFDQDYIRALEYGLPPTAGEGVGIDRLVMLLTDSPSIRDVLLFPHLRPET